MLDMFDLVDFASDGEKIDNWLGVLKQSWADCL